MKNLLLSFALMTGLTMSAQVLEPIFEKAGKMVKVTFLHQNGKVSQTGYYLNKKLHGEWTMFCPEGKKLATGKYDQGIKTGKWFFWEGEALKEVDFINNKIAAITQWNNKGTVVLNK